MNSEQVGEWGTGNAYLDARLLQQLTEIREDVLYKVLLELRKEYYSLNRERYMDIIGGYRVGPQI